MIRESNGTGGVSSRGSRRPTAILPLLAALLLPLPTLAQGFAIYEHGTCVMGRAGAAVAHGCGDGSEIFFNPAQLTDGEGWTVTAGITGIFADGTFTADRTGESTELTTDPAWVPHVFVRRPLGDRWGVGLGVYAPYGLANEWPTSFDGAFVGYRAELQSIYVQPTLAFDLSERISLGVGVAAVTGSVELARRLDLSAQPVPAAAGLPAGTTFGQLGVPFHTAFADVDLRGDADTGVGVNIGLEVALSDGVSLGVRYLTAVEIEYDGTADFTQVSTGLVLPPENPFGLPGGTPLDVLLAASGIFAEGGPLSDQGVVTRIEMPAQLVAGLAARLTRGFRITADYQWTGWSAFDRVPLEFETAPPDELVEEFEDTHAVRVGGEYALADAWTVRAGYLHHTAASPDQTVTPLLPEGVRNEVTTGVGWSDGDLLTVDAAYHYIGQNDRRGRVRNPPPGQEPTVDLNSGLYSFSGHLFGVTLSVHF